MAFSYQQKITAKAPLAVGLVIDCVNAVYGGQFCTFQEAARFYSFRRDGITGRMASLIWLQDM